MNLGILQDLGLTQNEAKIYEVLIENNKLSSGEISSKSGIHRRNVYDAISRLINKGLIFTIIGQDDSIYQAVSPVKLKNLLSQQQAKLEKILPGLERKYQTVPDKSYAFVYQGIEGFKNYLQDILRLRQDVFFIGAKAYWFDSKIMPFLKSYLADIEQAGIKLNMIFDAQVKKQLPNVMKEFNANYKILPEKYSTQASIDVFGDYVVTYKGIAPAEIEENIKIYVIVDKILADSYRQWFQFIWDSLPEDGKNTKSSVV